MSCRTTIVTIGSMLPLFLQNHSFAIEAVGEATVRRMTRQQLKRDVDLIKLMETGRGLTPCVKGEAQLTEIEMTAACGEARRSDQTAVAQAQGTEEIKNAIRSGVTTIEHGVNHDDECNEVMLTHGVHLVAALAAPYQIVRHGTDQGIPEFAARKNEEAINPHRTSFRKTLKAGVQIAMGTDAGTAFNLRGDFATELELAASLGMTIKNAI